VSTTTSLTVADLRPIDLFDELDDAEVGRWLAVATPMELAPGDRIAEAGEPSPGFHLLLEGTIRALRIEGGQVEPLGSHVGPTWMGAIPTLTETAMSVRMECVTACRVARIEPEPFIALVLSQRLVHRRILRQFSPVMTRVSAIDANRERLAALGTMAAGLAHELNNPAAAAKRAAAELADALDVLGAVIGEFVESGVERAEAEQLVGLQRAAVAQAAERGPLGALDAADAEDELLERLEDLGVPDAHRLAEPLASAGLDQAWLDEVARLAGPATGAALAWVAASLTTRGLAGELRESADRMSRLVGAVKSYAYMDRGEVVRTDLHEGLETTLVVLGHKLKPTRIQVVRHYDRSLPEVTVHGSELNQVWTNLLDNAIDALGEAGTITITTCLDGDCAVVEVADDGPGIPPEVRNRVFDPFFTTKGVGQGTGLGLDTARRIVVDRHRGSITVESEPGRTVFRVRMPLS
jgi:signal transduction histidine kinase